MLGNTLANLEGKIEHIQMIGTYQVYLVQINLKTLNEFGNALYYFLRN